MSIHDLPTADALRAAARESVEISPDPQSGERPGDPLRRLIPGNHDAETQTWHPLPPTEAERAHAEAVRAEQERQNSREDRARRISDDVLRDTYDGRRLIGGSQLGHALVRRLMERAALAAMNETENAR